MGMLDDDGTPAGADAVLSATMEYRDGMRRIKDALMWRIMHVRQRINITVAMVPPRSLRQIEPGCLRALKAQERSERMEQWKSLKYETALTKQALRRFFPRGMESDQGFKEYVEHVLLAYCALRMKLGKYLREIGTLNSKFSGRIQKFQEEQPWPPPLLRGLRSK